MKTLHIVAMGLFIIAFIVSVIGPFMSHELQPFMWIWTFLLIVAGWIVQIIGIIKR